MSQNMQAIHQAIYNLLSQDTLLMEKVQGIYDHPPLEPSWPCIVFGATNARDWSTKHRRGAQVLMEMHVLCDQAGRLQTMDIMDRLSTILKEQLIAAEDLQLVAKQVEQSALPPMQEDALSQGTVRFRAFFEEAA